jgi:hypothetical protein
MTGAVKMRGRVLRRRIVTASDVAAFGTTAQMQPPAAGRKTLDAPGTRGRHGSINELIRHRGKIYAQGGAEQRWNTLYR